MSYPRFADISRTFAPGRFAAVMGTGVLALKTARGVLSGGTFQPHP